MTSLLSLSTSNLIGSKPPWRVPLCRHHIFWILILICRSSSAFTVEWIKGQTQRSQRALKRRTSPLTVCAYVGPDSSGRSYNRRNGRGSDMKSKRQERVGQLVMTELSHIIHSGVIKGANVEYLDDELRTRISVVSADVSPDLRQARVSISVRPVPNSVVVSSKDVKERTETSSTGLETNVLENLTTSSRRPSPSVDRRRAYAWLVRNTKPIRYTLAQKLSHMKTCPDLTFVQVDVSAAVDVMYLIDKLSSTNGNYKRENLDLFASDEVTRGIVGGLDFDATDDDDDDWEEEADEEFFNSKESL